MKTASTNQIKALHAILRKQGLISIKTELVASASGGRTESSKELTAVEMKALLESLSLETSDNKMRRKIIKLAHDKGWQVFDQRKAKLVADMQRINNWCVKYGQFHKPLNEHDTKELVSLVSQFEKMVED